MDGDVETTDCKCYKVNLNVERDSMVWMVAENVIEGDQEMSLALLNCV